MIADEAEARAFVATLCDESAIIRLERLIAELAEENARQNLVAKNSLAHVWQRHIADSAQLLQHVEARDGPWLDLGSGAGFPGLVVSAMRPESTVILVESRRRRVDWLERMCDLLALANCRVEGCRLEQVEAFSAAVISARAFAPLPRLLRLSSRFSTRDTQWVLPKGRSAEQEVHDLPESQRRMFHVEQSLTDPDAGIILGHGKMKGSK